MRALTPQSQCSGFTLVELLVVVAIVALLVAILLPALNQARAVAQAAECMSNLRQISTANVLYANDYDDRLVPYSVFDPTAINTSGGKGVNVRWCWSDDTSGDPTQAIKNGLLAPYLNNTTAIAGCPAYQVPADVVDFYKQGGLAYPVAVDYGYNGLLLGFRHPNFYNADPSVPGYRLWVGYRLGEIPQPSSKVAFADSGQIFNGQVTPNPTICPPVALDFSNGWPRADAVPSVHGRHPGHTANVAWVDNHVSSKPVRVYDDQPAAQHSAQLGYMAPDGPRNNEWMFVK